MTPLYCCTNPTCASELHMARTFAHSVLENMGAMKGWEEEIWEPKFGQILFKEEFQLLLLIRIIKN